MHWLMQVCFSAEMEQLMCSFLSLVSSAAKLEVSPCYTSKRTNNPALCLESGPPCYVGSQLHAGPVSADRVCYKHCPGVLCGHCPPVAIPRPAKSSCVCGEGWRWSRLLWPLHQLCSEEQLQWVTVLLHLQTCWTSSQSCAGHQLLCVMSLNPIAPTEPGPALQDLIPKLCCPPASPGDEHKSHCSH